MDVSKTTIPGLLVLKPTIYRDDRGSFLETFQATRYREIGITDEFVQDNLSYSTMNVLRGMHFQVNEPQSQLVYVSLGEIFDAAVDLRTGSPTYGKWFGTRLSAKTGHQLYMPAGFAHGFCVTTAHANVHYKVSREYDGHDEGGVAWNDPDIGLVWPVKNPIVSARDQAYPRLAELPESGRPHIEFRNIDAIPTD